MRALVTGSEGLVGRHMSEALMDRGYQVDEVDVVNGADALDYFQQSEVQHDLIVHAAYRVGGRASIDGVNLFLAENVQLDGAMFNYALRTRAKRVLYFSSSAAYPTRLQDGAIPHSLRESDVSLHGDSRGLLGHPDTHYGWAKLTGEKMAEMARKMGIPVHVVRPFSGYADDQSMDYPFPSLVSRAVDGELSVWGPPEQTRDWIHMDDVILACFALMKADVQEPINLCTGRGNTMAAVMQKAYYQFYGHKLSLNDIEFQLDKPTGVIHRVGNPEKLFKYYRPGITLREGVRRALANL